MERNIYYIMFTKEVIEIAALTAFSSNQNTNSYFCLNTMLICRHRIFLRFQLYDLHSVYVMNL